LHAVEKWGKTSFGAMTRKPIFIETRQETGLETLLDNGRLPDTPHFPECKTWEELRGMIETLIVEPHEYKTLIVDTMNGAERMCHEFVCQREYNGDWGKKGFASYQQGYSVSLPEWRLFLGDLDRLREQKRMAIMLLCHSKIKTFKNPEGADYDRYQPDVHEQTWSLTHKWADCILFGNFSVTVTETDPEKKGKGTGGSLRVMYTQRSAAYDAGNRLGLPEDIDMGNSPQEAWANFAEALKAGKAAA
jgi:AAA domain